MQRIDQRVGTRPFIAFRQALDHLFKILYPDGDVKPVEYILATITEVDLGAAHGVAAVGQESHRLTHTDAFLREKRHQEWLSFLRKIDRNTPGQGTAFDCRQLRNS